jgi:hypothetical protein
LARQARLQITELRDLDLELARQSAGALGEDIKDELAAIDNPKIKFLFEIARLRRTETVVEDRERRAVLARDRAQLADLALADKGARIDFLQILLDLAAYFRAGSFCQRGQFGKRVFPGDLAFTA